MRHMWKRWKAKTERCVRPGCPVLRKKLRGYKGNHYTYHSGVQAQWYAKRPPCLGGSTAN